MFSFCHVGFMAIGAYTTGLLTIPVDSKVAVMSQLPGLIMHAHWNSAAAILFGGVVASVFGLPHRSRCQLVDFPQDGWFDVPGTLESGAGPFVEEALRCGARVVGGNVNAALWPSLPESRDPFVPFGRADPLEALLLLAQLINAFAPSDLELLWRCATTNGARALRLERYGLDPGDWASFVIFDERSVSTAILHQAD